MKMLKVFITGLSMTLLASCASQKAAEEKVHAEVKNETVVKSEELAQNAHSYITNSKTLSAEQKASLLSLQEKTQTESKALNEEINKTKMVFMKTLMEPKINKKEVSVLKKDLRKLGKKQMEMTLNAYEEARKIISPISDKGDKEFLFNAFMMRQNNSL